MSATATAKRAGRKGKQVPAEFPAPTWEVRDFLRTEMTFSVVSRGGCGFSVEPGRVPGALATFEHFADMEPEELTGSGCQALRQVKGFGDVAYDAVSIDGYEGGQALHLAGKVGAALRTCEMLGSDWPEVGCLAAWINYPVWLCAVALDEYRAQRDG